MTAVTPTPGQLGAFVDNRTLSGVNSDGGIYVDTLTNAQLIRDGVTSNVAALKSLAQVLQGASPELPVPVTFVSIGNPTKLSINPTVPSGGTATNPAVHYLKPNQAFYFTISQGGSLPSPLIPGQLYYLTAANLTPTQFTFSAVNNYDLTIGEGLTVDTTGGTLSGTASIVLSGRDVNILIPPGPYFGNNAFTAGGSLDVTPNGITRIKYSANGAIFDGGITFGVQPYTNDAKTWQFGVFDLINTTPNSSTVNGLNSVVRLQTPANAANYYIGQWVTFFGLDVQNPFGRLASGPPNNHFQEFKKIIGINLGTGDLTFAGPLKFVYLSTFPNLFNAVGQICGGAALIAQMHPAWDTEIEICGARYISDPGAVFARSFIWENCVFEGYGYAPGQTSPTTAQKFIYRKCRFHGPGAQYIEVDKMIEYLEFDSCTFYEGNILFQSPSVQVCLVKNFLGDQILGTPRQIEITNSITQGLLIGPYIGVTDSCYVNNSSILFLDMLDRNDDNDSISPTIDMTVVPNWSFSGGIFTRNISALPSTQSMSWMIPGAKIYFTDASNQFKHDQNMGSPFAITNVYMDVSGNPFSFETTLRAVPTRQTTIAVTSISNATPCVVTTTAPHGLSNGDPFCFTTTGVLPAPLSISTVYWVANKAASTFNVALTKAAALAGTPLVNTTTAGSGSHTVYGNPLCFRPHPCPRFTSIANRGCSAILDLNGAIDEPLFSRVKRGFVAKQSTLGGGNGPHDFEAPNPKIWGTLNDRDKVMFVNVIVAGVGASQTLNISCPGFTQPGLALSTFSQTIDTTTKGIRIVGATTATSPAGVAGTEAIAAYADWIAGPLVFTWASPPATLANSPVVEFEMHTDQGITKFSNMMGAPAVPASGSEIWQWCDSSIKSQYGTVP